MRVFIDSMIYIRYFNADVVESKILQKIEKAIDDSQGKIKLVFPEITFDEVYRNATEEISDYKKKIHVSSLIANLPPSVLESKTYTDAKTLKKQLDVKMEELQKEYQTSMDTLMGTVESLRSKAEKIAEPADLFERAHRRRLLGKLPYPTKLIDGLGDWMVWELLLGIDDQEKTVVVTEDWGWKNQKGGDANALHPAMQKEWENGSRGNILLYNSLSNFLKKEAPEVKLSKKDLELDKKASTPPLYLTLDQLPSGTIAVGSVFASNMRPGLISAPSVGSMGWQPVNVVATNSEVRCVNCGGTFHSSECLITMRGYYCQNCYSRAGSA